MAAATIDDANGLQTIQRGFAQQLIRSSASAQNHQQPLLPDTPSPRVQRSRNAAGYDGRNVRL